MGGGPPRLPTRDHYTAYTFRHQRPLAEANFNCLLRAATLPHWSQLKRHVNALTAINARLKKLIARLTRLIKLIALQLYLSGLYDSTGLVKAMSQGIGKWEISDPRIPKTG